MDFVTIMAILVGSYVLGSVPFGLIFVRLKTGQDVRTIQSGRTGGTNAGRAAGPLVGLTTAAVDGLKAAVAVWVCRYFLPNLNWMHVAAPIVVILGHNYSVFLVERLEGGKFRLRGGAGGASCVGGSFGLWAPSMFLIVPLAAAIFYFIGYASMATMSVALLSSVLFLVLAILGLSPWEYVAYGLIALLILMWALRPNIRALRAGNERLLGFRAKRRASQSVNVNK